MSASLSSEAVTADSLLKGRVRLYQPARGARMSLDPVLLAGFVGAPYGCFLDIGAGTGALSFLLLARDPAARGVAVEIQPQLAALAARGRDDNGWTHRLDILAGDARRPGEAIGAARFDLVVTNPPFRPLREGNVSPNRERAIAHHEIALALGDWLDCAARALRPGGRLAAILPAAREAELLDAVRARGLHPARVRLALPSSDRPPLRVLCEARAGAAVPLVREPALVIHGPGGGFSAEVAGMLGESPGGP
jgi:tRNA1Val (adenine37-N6)-methyltransferase